MHTDTPMFIATESILWLRRDGTETMIEVKVGTRYSLDAHTWAHAAVFGAVKHS